MKGESKVLNKMKELSERIAEHKDRVLTEEATKNAFVMPFLQALGYDVFDPSVVVPEYIADVGGKKGEKVDYAILQNGSLLILIEAKNHLQELNNHQNQLIRYFTVTTAKFAILTNGIEYRFFTDIDEQNKMDGKPFFTLDLENLKERDVKFLEKFAHDQLNIDNILASASSKKYIGEVKQLLKKEVENPSPEFVWVVAKKILMNKRITKNISAEFYDYVKSAFSETLLDMAAAKIEQLQQGLEKEQADNSPDLVIEPAEDTGVMTTEEELQAYYIVKSILADIIPLEDIIYKDTKSYFSINYKGHPWKWICHLFLEGKTKCLSLNVDRDEMKEEKIKLEKVEDIYQYKEKIKAVASRFSDSE
jgi:predicted type IV restriction endonuclease